MIEHAPEHGWELSAAPPLDFLDMARVSKGKFERGGSSGYPVPVRRNGVRPGTVRSMVVGSNLTRDIRIDGAPVRFVPPAATVHPGLWRQKLPGAAFIKNLWTPELCLRKSTVPFKLVLN
jgi:hypothetical protein